MWKSISRFNACFARKTFPSSSDAAENIPESSHKNEERGTDNKENLKTSLPREKTQRQRILANVRFSAQHSPAIKKMRQELQTELFKLKDHFEKLKAENWSPYEQEFNYDLAFLPIAVKAENARNPKLNLHCFDHPDGFQSLADALKSGKLQNGRALFRLPGNEAHLLAADIKTIDGKTSVLVLEPVSVKKNDGFMLIYSDFVTWEMSDRLPQNANLTVLSIDAQKSTHECRIYALSSASKMAKESKFFEAIHKDNLSGQLGVVAEKNEETFKARNENNSVSFDTIRIVKESASPSNQEIESNEQTDRSLSTETALNNVRREPELLIAYPKARVVDAHSLMPASFQKHTQAMSALKELDDEKLTKTVNKQDDTLLSRFDKHAVERFKKNEDDEEGGSQQGKLQRLRFNASIEEKRLTYLDRAIAYLKDVPEEEIPDLWNHFKKPMEKNKFLSETGAFSQGREIGPKREVGSKAQKDHDSKPPSFKVDEAALPEQAQQDTARNILATSIENQTLPLNLTGTDLRKAMKKDGAQQRGIMKKVAAKLADMKRPERKTVRRMTDDELEMEIAHAKGKGGNRLLTESMKEKKKREAMKSVLTGKIAPPSNKKSQSSEQPGSLSVQAQAAGKTKTLAQLFKEDDVSATKNQEEQAVRKRKTLAQLFAEDDAHIKGLPSESSAAELVLADSKNQISRTTPLERDYLAKLERATSATDDWFNTHNYDVVHNNGNQNNCLLLALLQHVTGRYENGDLDELSELAQSIRVELEQEHGINQGTMLLASAGSDDQSIETLMTIISRRLGDRARNLDPVIIVHPHEGSIPYAGGDNFDPLRPMNDNEWANLEQKQMIVYGRNGLEHFEAVKKK